MATKTPASVAGAWPAKRKARGAGRGVGVAGLGAPLAAGGELAAGAAAGGAAGDGAPGGVAAGAQAASARISAAAPRRRQAAPPRPPRLVAGIEGREQPCGSAQ